MKAGEIVVEKMDGSRVIFDSRQVAQGILQHLELKLDVNGNVAIWKHHKLVKHFVVDEIKNINITDRNGSVVALEFKV